VSAVDALGWDEQIQTTDTGGDTQASSMDSQQCRHSAVAFDSWRPFLTIHSNNFLTGPGSANVRKSDHRVTVEPYLHLWSNKQSRDADQLQLRFLDTSRSRKKSIHVVNTHIQRLAVHLVYLTHLQCNSHGGTVTLSAFLLNYYYQVKVKWCHTPQRSLGGVLISLL